VSNFAIWVRLTNSLFVVVEKQHVRARRQKTGLLNKKMHGLLSASVTNWYSNAPGSEKHPVARIEKKRVSLISYSGGQKELGNPRFIPKMPMFTLQLLHHEKS
jgi:hypothetical protein